ncbi:hypothetical protein ACOME3_003988 [Neoechinorhynchus agilis]
MSLTNFCDNTFYVQGATSRITFGLLKRLRLKQFEKQTAEVKRLIKERSQLNQERDMLRYFQIGRQINKITQYVNDELKKQDENKITAISNLVLKFLIVIWLIISAAILWTAIKQPSVASLPASISIFLNDSNISMVEWMIITDRWLSDYLPNIFGLIRRLK